MYYLKPASAFRQKVKDRFRPPGNSVTGYSVGMDKLNHIRFEPSQTSLWTGFNGHGKSLFLNQLMLASVADYDERYIVASLEMLPDRNLCRTARQVTHKSCPDDYEIDHCLDWCDERIQFYDYVGSADVPTMLENFVIGVETLGVSSIIVDSLMKMGLAEDDYSKQKLFVEDMSNFALKYNVHVHIVAHSRKQQDESNIPGKMDVMGAGGMTNIVDNGFTVWRNKKKEKKMNDYFLAGQDPDELLLSEKDALIDCWKSRDLGADAEKTYALWFDPISMQYLERYGREPRSFTKQNSHNLPFI